MNRQRSFLAVVVTTALLLITAMLSGCGSQSEEVISKENIKIGAILDFTGAVADLGPRFQDGIELRLDQLNYEIEGRKIEFICEDGGTDVSISLDKARKLVENDGVEVIIGPLMGGIQVGLAPYFAENNVMATSLINIEKEVSEEYDNWIGFPSTTETLYIPLGWYAYDELGYKKITTIGSDYVAGYSYIGGVVKGFEERGGAVIQQQWVPIALDDFGPYLVNMADADAVASFNASALVVARLMKQHNEFGLEIPHLLTDAGSALELEDLQTLGPLLENKVIGSAAYVWTINNPKNIEFVEAFQDKYGRRPGEAEFNAYTITSIILAGLEETGGDTSFEKLRPAILGLNIETPQGPLSFSTTGVAVGNRYIMELQKENNEYVWKPIRVYHGEEDPEDYTDLN